MTYFNQNSEDNVIPIVTVDSQLKHCLMQKTQDILEDEFPLAQKIMKKLIKSLQPHLPAAGLAAPQIGVNKSVFIYSFDRTPENLEAVINPSFIPIGDKKILGWEGCLSIMLSNGLWKLAKIPRYETVKVQYLDLTGKSVEKLLTGFGAKVFQHEYDHLQGIKNIDREDAIIMEFTTKEEMVNFLDQVKKDDSKHYNIPN